VLPLVGLFQFDLKHFDSRRHRALTGAGNERILANAELLLARGARVEFRMPLVPGVNDGVLNLEQLARFLAAHQVRSVTLLPYHRLYLDKYAALGLTAPLPDLAPATAADLARVTLLLARHAVAAAVV
jgi:pyruvate formate lyase activating enzyme